MSKNPDTVRYANPFMTDPADYSEFCRALTSSARGQGSLCAQSGTWKLYSRGTMTWRLWTRHDLDAAIPPRRPFFAATIYSTDSNR